MALLNKKCSSGLILFVMAIVFLFIACGNRQSWSEVESFKNAKAGTHLRLQPLSLETLTVSTNQEFRFRCINETAGGEIDYRTVVGAVINGSTIEKVSSTIKKWSPSESDVVFNYYAIPPFAPIGKARMYFYLVDKDEKCISNIIEWKVVFVKSKN